MTIKELRANSLQISRQSYDLSDSSGKDKAEKSLINYMMEKSKGRMKGWKRIVMSPELNDLLHVDEMTLQQYVNTQQQFEPYVLSDEIKDKHHQWSTYLRILDMGDMKQIPSLPDIDWSLHPLKREDRFPSVQERVEYYMGHWYNASIEMSGLDFRRDVFRSEKTTRRYHNGSPFMVDLFGREPMGFANCNMYEKGMARYYCKDAVDLALLQSEASASLIMHFGDEIVQKSMGEMTGYPYFNKVRRLRDTDIETIIWPLNRRRHLLPPLYVPENDIPWDQKVGGSIVWRGGPKGNSVNFEDGKISRTSKRQSVNQKWNLVSKYAGSSVVDAKFVVRDRKKEEFQNVPDEFRGDFYNMTKQLQFKYLLSLEGNDVASGLKWMMFSNSVVFLPPPTYISWFMESLLIPFVHFIPVKEDLSDLEQMIAWADSHPDETKRIAERSTLFAYDLLFHPDALRDEELVLQGIMERYEQNFGSLPTSKLHPLPSAFNWKIHPVHRSDRFPSVSKRMEYYMGTWFNRTGLAMDELSFIDNLSDVVRVRDMLDMRLDADLIFEGDKLSDCAQMGTSDFGELAHYCRMAHPHLMSNIDGSLKSLNAVASLDSTVKLMHFGNSLVTRADIPVFVKQRSLDSNGQGILWPFWNKDIYHLVTSGAIENADIPFDEKKQIVYWRTNLSTPNTNETELKRSEKVKVMRHNGALDCDSLEFMLSAKYLLCANGSSESSSSNGCGDDLLWMLLSQSIVMMPWPLRTTSWMMEDELEPFIHFIPIKSDLSDVEDMLRWSIDHPTESLAISERSTLYVHDMLIHPSAERDMSEVQFRMIEKYSSQFGVKQY
eukprot:CAMPEP_0196822984 /NCGR_PEP_ID=MMETSP1362-20130617/85575_1 /TAXON_ID=163516 /ORGANISM="Leptocylindrus danicus, Strain CCMP1856" /LENGTH=830 /DNA_ID=CAMNT_0042202695 /DNA_START=296 /DNA_END=2788 /DNA_ORIENTATION=-